MESVGGDHNNEAAAHVLVIAHSIPGHMTPVLTLATQLARRGITITFVSQEDAISRLISADGFESSSELQSLDFRFVGLRIADGQALGDGRLPRGVRLRSLREALQPVLDKFSRDKSAGIGGPTSVVSDMVFPWTQDVADELQIPWYMFVPSGVIYARVTQGCLPYHENGQFQVSETDGKLVAFNWPVCIPGLPPLSYHDLPVSFREDPSLSRKRGESMGHSAGVLVNSFFELEENVIETWRNVGFPGFKHIKVPNIYPVGPLFSTSSPNVKVSSPGLEDSATKCLLWLGSQPKSSVLYVAFGTLFRLRPEQRHEVALGLEASKQRFLWVIPQSSFEEETPSLITEFLPPGFEARVGDRGCIVTGWAPQLQILAHPATRGFFTHSGWNSSLESIILGVPMISWPQGAEQQLNSKYLVDDLKLAERLQTGPENIPKWNEVERVVRLLMVESEGRAMKSRVEEFQRKAAAAVADGGSQSRIFQEFFDDVRKNGRRHTHEQNITQSTLAM